MKAMDFEYQLKTAIINYIVKKLPEFSEDTDAGTSFSRLGLDSLGHVEISSAIEDAIGMQVDPETAFNYPTLNSLVAYLASTLDDDQSSEGTIDEANA